MPPVESWKAEAGFEKGYSDLYRTWRVNAKLKMAFLEILGKEEVRGTGKWEQLMEWALSQSPLKEQAHYHSDPDYLRAVDNLLQDVSKKRRHTLGRQADTNGRSSDPPPPCKYHLLFSCTIQC